MRAKIADTPVEDPDDDLLGTAPYARTLAEFIYRIQPPFTVGIYGEWGSGKTSFVNFVHYFLRTEVPDEMGTAKFVSFSAWPYKTSDELWRALILAIARTLLLGDASGAATNAGAANGVAVNPAATNTGAVEKDAVEKDAVEKDAAAKGTAAKGTARGQGPAAISGARSGFREFLSRDALVLRPGPPETGPEAEYARLVARLDAMHGGVGKGSPQVDPEQLGLTLANAAVAALASVSPLAAAARKLFGLPSGVDTAKLIPRERNEATRDRIQSMEDFRAAFEDLFEQKVKKTERLVVFIDDLDRCMPDAALDLLEAIKNFLGQVPCVFLVAADEKLIGQALRLRYRDLVAAEGGASAEAFAQKGQEYFEKIIQLAIRVPQRTREQTHNFIAAQFPQWLPATDVIQAAVGTNPRRLKQYCSWLQYRWMVALTIPDR